MQFKKGIIAVLLLIVAAVSVGCTQKEVTIDVAALADNLKNNILYKDELSETDISRYEVKSEDVVKSKIYISTGATAEEIAVIEAKDAEAAVRVKEGLSQKITDQKFGFEDYNPEEMVKLNSPVLEVRGKYVILCLSDDNAKANQEIDLAFKAK